MMRSLYSGVSGLRTHQTKMDVIGNNIANVNTVAFKSSAVTFSDIMYQTTSGASAATQTIGGTNAKQIGLGVATGATKVAITSAGASESTGNAFDIKLSDSNSTNFFIVSNGSETLFTRAGSFYVDGNGNLAMSSTGYLVEGWQVDKTTGNIKKDTVSALRIMQASNLTSAPEATENATVSGVIDKNDTDVTSDSGYYMTLNFYDNRGYSYTAKFAIKDSDSENGLYSTELVSIVDEDNNDILADYVETEMLKDTTKTKQQVLADIFGKETTATKKFSISSSNKSALGTTSKASTTGTSATKVTTITIDGVAYNLTGATGFRMDTTSTSDTYGQIFATLAVTDSSSTASGTTSKEVNISQYYGVNSTSLANYPGALTYDTTTGDVSGINAGNFSIDEDGKLNIKYNTTDYNLSYSVADGTFQYVDSAGTNSVTLNTSKLGSQFSNINVDFSKTLNYDNGGTSTVGIEKGATDGTTGYGKALGTLTGVSVSSNGEIYGSYDNGNTVLLGQIAVAQFNNASGLESVGNNCYAETLNSGEFDGIGVDVTADGGSMSTGQLEMSNVDLSSEFTSMITTQRGFQANSRIITVSDSMLEELTNLKRS